MFCTSLSLAGAMRTRPSTQVASPAAAQFRLRSALPATSRKGTVQGGRTSRGGCVAAMGDESKRRKGRPAWKRSPNDTPLRDGNRDRLVGLLTTRAVATLLYYTMETNQPLHHWINAFYQQHPIPKQSASWADVSGETFLRKLMLAKPDTQGHPGMDPLFDCTAKIDVDPKNVAQRIMDIRTELAKEWVEDLLLISEENGSLLRESLFASLEGTLSMEDFNSFDAQDSIGGEDQLCDPDDTECKQQLMAEWNRRVERIEGRASDDA